MCKFEIKSPPFGASFGIYEAETPEAAIRRFYDDAGFKGEPIENIPGACVLVAEAV